MKLLKRKPIIIAIVMLVLFLIVGICAIKINSNKNKKSYSTSAIVSEKKEKAKSDKGKKKLKDSNEDNKVETNEVIKKDEEKKNEEHEKKDSQVINDTNNNQSLSISSNNNSNNGATNNSSNNQSSNNNVPSVSVNTDEQDWNNFINDYSTLLILGGNIDFYSQSEQVAESNKWVNLGYRTELPTVCTYLSTGQRCVYSLFVFAGEGTCGTSTSISVNWRSRTYISDVVYLKSLGYNCP